MKRLLIPVFSLLALISLSQFARAEDKTAKGKEDESWNVIYMAGQRVGYGRAVSREEERDGRTVYITTMEEHITIRRFGQAIQIHSTSTTEEAEDGRLLSYAFEMRNPPASSTSSNGTVKGNQLTIESIIGGRKRERTIPFDPTVKSAAYQDRQLQDNPLKPGETRKMKVFIPEHAKVADLKLSADDYQDIKVHDGTTQKLLKVRMSMSILPGVEIKSYLNKEGENLRSDVNLFGIAMVTYTVPREVALEKIAGGELDVAVSTLVRVKNPPVKLHESTKVVYRITTPGRDPSEYLPTGGTHEIKKTGDDSIELTVSSIEPPKNIQSSRNEQKEFLTDTGFLQKTDVRVKEHATKAAAGSQDPGTIAVRMEKYVHKELKKKNFSTALASAAEVAKNLEGDCTEHACLLAAMLRSKGIPSRVAVGLVYADSLGAFGGHMWTEAWLDGKWVPLDATLGRGGIGGGHLKLADSGMDDDGPAPVTSFLPLMNLLSGVSIEIVKVER